MRWLRVAALALLFALIAVGGSFWYVASHQTDLVRFILTRITQTTGVRISVAHSRLALGPRLVVLLEQPHITFRNRDTARFNDIRIVFSYGALVRHVGLPLYWLSVEGGTINLQKATSAPQGAAPSTDLLGESITQFNQHLKQLSGISRHFQLTDISLVDGQGRVLAYNISGVAYPQHFHLRDSPWIVRVRSEADEPVIGKVGIYLGLRAGRIGDHPGTVCNGRVWFWQPGSHQLSLGDFNATAQISGDATLTLSDDQQMAGTFEISARDLALDGAGVSSRLQLGSYWSSANYSVSQARAEVSDFKLLKASSVILAADAAVTQPWGPDRLLTFSANGLSVEISNLAGWLREFRMQPKLVRFVQGFKSGNLAFSQISLTRPVSPTALNLSGLRQLLRVDALLIHMSYAPPPGLKIPPLDHFDAQLTYAAGIAQLMQGSGHAGQSSISDISLWADLRNAPARWPYELRITGQLDTEQLYQASTDQLFRAEPQLPGRLLWIYGHAPVSIWAKDTLHRLSLRVPRDYLIRMDLGGIELSLKGLPSTIRIAAGNLLIRPGKVAFVNTIAVPLGETGNVVLNGVILTGTRPPEFDDLKAELHQVNSAKWLPLFVPPDQLSVSGRLGGTLMANSRGSSHGMPAIIGNLTVSSGSFQFGFLRNPIIVTRAATVELNGKGLVLNIPFSRLEGEPLNFRLAVPNLDRPMLRIDARVARLDLEVMRFIRPPWAPKTPPTVFPLPVSGHIEAQSGNFEKLVMTDISTDFTHNFQTWRVYNFRATAFNGSLDLNLAGHGSNDWVNINGDIAHMDAGPLLLLATNVQQAPIVGKLNAAADLWANTDTNFFKTLAGDISAEITDGTLNRFTLLRRILGLINLKNWLTAQVPDPRKTGVPFKTLTADFRGHEGLFYTDNLRLDGPVMEIRAKGDIDIGSSHMNMEIDLIPFQTANWIVNKLPIIGNNLALASKGLVAAYFHVFGPLDHPTIRPKPITSVAQFVIKTLALPINLIAPNTVK
jgi:AsmA-like C-terminal region